jgi:hypothetical protein
MEGLATQHQQMVNFEDYAMDSDAVVRQVALVQQVMNKVMKKDEHYGIIPGCQKPSLLKPGAEKLGFTFRLAPEYDVKIINMGGAHREYQVKCRLRHIPTSAMVGEGEGSCTTMEGKFRYRGGEKVPTDQPVPTEYWNLKKEGKMDQAIELIGGRGYGVAKINGKWVICEIGEKQEHDNPADYYNTCLKMAKKRAHVDAILTATAASDIFTQDVEDMTEVMPEQNKPAEQKQEQKPDMKAPQEKSGAPADNKPAREKLKDELELYCMTEQGVDVQKMGEVLTQVSKFGDNNGFTLDDLFTQKQDGTYKISDKWVGSAIGNLRKLVEKKG